MRAGKLHDKSLAGDKWLVIPSALLSLVLPSPLSCHLAVTSSPSTTTSDHHRLQCRRPTATARRGNEGVILVPLDSNGQPLSARLGSAHISGAVWYVALPPLEWWQSEAYTCDSLRVDKSSRRQRRRHVGQRSPRKIMSALR
jgi:hypothetical protein